MGIITNGILGGFRKRTGAVVGAFWRGLDVIRARPRKSEKPPTQEQLDQRVRFAMIIAFLKQIKSLIQIGYKTSAKVKTQMNIAVSENLKNAVTGVSPDFSIDFENVKYSKGTIVLPSDLTVTAVAGAKANLAWGYVPASDDEDYDGSDLITVVVYNVDKEKFMYVRNIAPRSAMAYVFQLPMSFLDDVLHCYASFNSVKNKPKTSNSVYLGAITVI
ncbi:DUF6266 family protein [Pedobacter sp. MC2016-14]|uniref:DUF6266 family protein n=1 Tax=Pedobacter sp. MC2016-14 TaxID=2897327 RepID=UPI001E4689FD|nr:DUF6266 family protein [Pedobacter sp. MC2016-14]MCD0487912.1 DUF6266 family protein [Pedobacter sp. MC2016-14]